MNSIVNGRIKQGLHHINLCNLSPNPNLVIALDISNISRNHGNMCRYYPYLVSKLNNTLLILVTIVFLFLK